MKDYSTEDLKRFWLYFFGDVSVEIDTNSEKLEKWNMNKSGEFYKSIKQLMKYPDILRLQMLEFSSYEKAVIDAVISFERWLALYFGEIVKQQPKRFLNDKGIYFRFKPAMKEIIHEFYASDPPDPELVKKLIQQERLNLGFAGKNFRKYFTVHAGFKIPSEKESLLKENFSNYYQIRLHRDNLVHPEPLERSTIPFPRTLPLFRNLIEMLIKIGNFIIDICQVYETN